MDLFPAIDLLDGRCVRLEQGDYARETVYDENPVTVARRYEDAGARWIHVVDLEAARTGVAANLAVIEAICAAVSCKVQTGGGVRSVAAAGDRLAAGAARVVVGTAAVEHPDVVTELTTLHPGRVAVGIDARGREVAIRGWQQGTGVDLLETAARFADAGVSAVVVTEISRDGMFTGPDLDAYTALLGVLGATPLVASGGVGTVDDLVALRSLEVEGRSLAGAIVGRALYEGRVDIEEAIAACSQPA
ncbi:MAG TPA: 1-(5-phosphoribosyl)-5-[(5-phosphoribosylamino)methylideneamino]imidazole-4-carboxamide isomerase [Acidimicrobiia bacterium]|jgi:phosphoribosylformimino-5-aminoimidazole carboxamide ribotide isomerase|nr:1-(5-phosphoribosyl)-5-[(5-phosphoribosylamino)methylideneamino]imidazole-4-carboxamide isomerase [Acidimicrobiia bacterium]